MAKRRCAQAARRRTLGDQGRPVPDRAAVRDLGHRRHDPDQRVRTAARSRALPVARRGQGGDRGGARGRPGRVAAGGPDRQGDGERRPPKPSTSAKAATKAGTRAEREPTEPPPPPEPKWIRDLRPGDRRKATELIDRLDGPRRRGRSRPRRSPGPRSPRACRPSRGWPSSAGSGAATAEAADVDAAVSAAVEAMIAGRGRRTSASRGVSSTTAAARSRSSTSTARARTHERPAASTTGRGVTSSVRPPRGGTGYLADFSSVRRQRVQTSVFVG